MIALTFDLAPIVGLDSLRYRTCERSKRDEARVVKLVSPHASWERRGSGILDSHRWCYERSPDSGANDEARMRESMIDRRPVPHVLGSARVKPMPHFDALVAEAERVGWPREYRNDLFVHDLRMLDETDPSEPFVWALRNLGTHLYAVSWRCNFSGRIGFEHAPKSIAETFRVTGEKEQAHVRFYTWDGRHLTAHRDHETCAEAARVLGERWRHEFLQKRLG